MTREHVFLRIDPEERAGHPAPEELTRRAGNGAMAGWVRDCETEPETMTGAINETRP